MCVAVLLARSSATTTDTAGGCCSCWLFPSSGTCGGAYVLWRVYLDVTRTGDVYCGAMFIVGRCSLWGDVHCIADSTSFTNVNIKSSTSNSRRPTGVDRGIK